MTGSDIHDTIGAPAGLPRVSIVLPTYNGRRFIEESIRSCLAQTYQNIELIVVDDASTDSTSDIVAGLARTDHRIRLIRHGRNRKLPAALNTGFGMAEGDYWTWTSDDNQFKGHAIARMVEFLEAQKSIGMVYADYETIDETGIVCGVRRVGEPASLISSNQIGGCFLYRRSTARVVGAYDESMFLAEDYDYWLRVAGRFAVAPLHEVLYQYRIHPGMLTQTHTRSLRKTMFDRAQTKNVWRLKGVLPEAKVRAYQDLADWERWRGCYGWMARNLFYLGMLSGPGLAGYLWRRTAKKLLGAKG